MKGSELKQGFTVRTLRDSFARGFLAGLLVAAPLFSGAFMLEDEYGFLPAPALCPQSISLRRSDAELRFIARAIEKGRCTLVFASSEGSGVGGGQALHELIQVRGFTWVRDYEGFAPLRALAYLRRTNTHPVRMIVLANHHYARSSNRPLPDLGETWFAEAFAQTRLKNAGVLQLYMRERPASRIGPLRELLGRMAEPVRTLSFAKSAPEAQTTVQGPDNTSRDAVGSLQDTPFAHGLKEVCEEDGVQIVLLPLNANLERRLGLDPAAQMARIVDAAKVCRAVLLAEMDGPYWLDRIHWNEDGRRVLARRITDSSLL